jgi:hypothetical protein
VARPRRRRRDDALPVRRGDRRGAREPAHPDAGLEPGAAGPLPDRVHFLREQETYTNEFSAGWEKRCRRELDRRDFLLKRTWDFQGADDENVFRDAATGAFQGRPWPDYDSVLRTYAPNYSIQQFRSIQFLYTKNFAGGWGVNANYWYAMHQVIVRAFNPTRDTLQYLGFTEADRVENGSNHRVARARVGGDGPER